MSDLNYSLLLHILFFETPRRAREAFLLYPTFDVWRLHFLEYLAKIHASEVLSTRIKRLSNEKTVTDVLARLDEQGVSYVSISEGHYPELLRHIPDLPFGLFYKGNLLALAGPLLGVVGPRVPSEYGRQVTSILLPPLCHVFGIVSGMAQGVDAIAHLAALKEKTATIAVMGTSFDTVYPTLHRSLFEQICETGLVLSEYPPDVGVQPYHFSARNRLISGLSRGVLICEATEKSGSLVTARHALEQGREVFAVPGSIFSEQSKGVHRLLQDGAKLVTCVDDIIQEFYDLSVSTVNLIPAESTSVAVLMPPNLTPEEVQLWNCLSVETPIDLDEISRESGLLIHQILQFLTFFEIQGWVKTVSGQRYVLNR